MIKDLIIVPGHALFNDSVDAVPADFESEKYWILLPYQKNEVRFYVEHIKKSIEIAGENNNSIIIFSGGYTRKEANIWSEAHTYKAIAEHIFPDFPKNRMRTETNAYDSYQNLGGSIQKFKNTYGGLPENIFVVGWKFKEQRYFFHCQVSGFPLSHFNYVGVNNPVDIVDALNAEKRVLDKFKFNPLGTSGDNIDKPYGRRWLGMSKTLL